MTDGFETPALMRDAFRTRALERLMREPAPEAFDPQHLPHAGDHRLADNLAPEDGRLHKPAAVLVPVIAHARGVTMLLTERAAHLKDHAGQIAFPGGKIASATETPAEAALREAQEEIGLDPSLIEPLGYLEPYLSSTGYRIIPLVGLVAPDFTLRIDSNEVASVFEVPLGFLMDPTRHEVHEREWRGVQRRYFAMPYGERYIWGVTAGIIRILYERLYTP
jgi:8-oxo-dGTP pyrophosphatase MutT (NUDIX family)